MPGPGIAGSHYQYVNNIARGQQLPPETGFLGPSPNDVFAQRQAPSSVFPMFSPNGSQSQMQPTLPDNMLNPQFGGQQQPIPQQYPTASGQQTSPMQSLAGAVQQTSPPNPSASHSTFGGNLFDPHDLTQYNFDPASFNFGNHYGALEFGILGHMSSGAAETPPSDQTGQHSQSNGASYATPGTINSGYSDSPVNTQSYLFPPTQGAGDWRNDTQPNARQSGSNAYNVGGQSQDPSAGILRQEAPPAFAIGAGSSSITSPSSIPSPQGMMPGFDDSPSMTTTYPTNASHPGTQDRSAQQRPVGQTRSTISSPDLKAQSRPTHRPRDPSTIYDSVKEPYSYTNGFHILTAYLQRRLPPQKRLRVAIAIASIRPSFISCTKTLSRKDLIFMEQSFQRTLWEYEDFINACGTPTIVCRRSGEVAAVGKEFSILTGWKKDVLLGKEANLNINTGGSSGTPSTGTSSRGGLNTPRKPEGVRNELLDNSRPQPVFLAELFDDDSAIEFYEDFARLAFGDSRGSVTTRCKLLKYKTKDDPPFSAQDEDRLDNDSGSRFKQKRPSKVNGKNGIAGEAGMYQLGEKNGKVECSYCWTVKRDVFDIPMLIVMNVSFSASF